ncbi:hypothetical protein [Pseudomonas coronafaciens]|uniref:hypothetical protein n=1 Tax=Pseudomonas coronafaciens TaxID=53409 RepID=UPI000E3E245E|nr:hypothetical protein [Pseudomonas coronafaciens]
MKHKLSSLLLMLGTAASIAQAQTGEVPACATAAAQEFAVPAKLFKAMVLAYGWDEASPESRKRAESIGKYGPMGLGGQAIADMAKGLGVSQASIKEDACTNYRAAAWWYVNRSGGNQSLDEWAAVTRFYYGNESRRKAHATERVKTIYSEL